MLHLVLHSLLGEKKASLRVMEELFNSRKFQIAAQIDTTTRFTSIRDMIATINPDFFARLFEGLFDLFSRHLGEEAAIARYDSTMPFRQGSWSRACALAARPIRCS